MASAQTKVHEEGLEDLRHVTTLHSFDANTFVENIAVRRSGSLLLTVENTAELIHLDPRAQGPPCLVHKFSAGVTGIVEVGDDVFYISSGSIGQKGTYAIYKVDMSPFAVDASNKTVSPASVSKLVDVPEALFLNGSTLLNSSKGIFLAADSLLGAVLAVDTKNATVQTWLQHKALAKTTDNPYFPGVNGIKIRNGYLYLSNTDAKIFYRAGLTGTGEADGSVDQVYDKCNIDDFAFDAEGSVYLTSHVFNSVVKIRSNGVRTRIAGGPEDPVVAGTTALAFGRTVLDRTTIYVTTNGGMSNPVNGKVGPARVLAIDVGHPEATDHRPGQVLFVATSHDELGNGAKTGVWLEEAAEPYIELVAQGFVVTVASPKGGPVPIDPRSNPNAVQSELWKSAISALGQSLPLSKVSSQRFDGIFLPGGHGPMFDLAKDDQLASLLRGFDDERKPIAAVCHGPAGIANVKLSNGKYLVEGKEVTSYSWQEEILAKLDKHVPFNLEQTLVDRGGLFTAPVPRKSHVVVDGLLVTGQNPASSKATAIAFGSVLASYRARHHLSSATSAKYRVICHIKDDGAANDARLELRPKHYDFLSANQSRIVAGGPTTDSTGKPTSMLLIVEATSEEDAADFLKHEPYTASGKVFSSVDVQKWIQVLPTNIQYEMAKLK